MKSTKMLYLAFALIMAACPMFLNAYWTDVFNNVGLYAILALSLPEARKALQHLRHG